jgi:hypothetical protein
MGRMHLEQKCINYVTGLQQFKNICMLQGTHALDEVHLVRPLGLSNHAQFFQFFVSAIGTPRCRPSDVVIRS